MNNMEISIHGNATWPTVLRPLNVPRPPRRHSTVLPEDCTAQIDVQAPLTDGVFSGVDGDGGHTKNDGY